MYQNVYSQYKEQSVETMTQGELLNCLFDETVKRLVRAKLFAEKGQFDAFEQETQRARDIVIYLDRNLDRSYPVSAGLHKLYDYFNFAIARSHAGRKTEPIEEMLPLLEELRDTWKQADKLSRQKD